MSAGQAGLLYELGEYIFHVRLPETPLSLQDSDLLVIAIWQPSSEDLDRAVLGSGRMYGAGRDIRGTDATSNGHEDRKTRRDS